MITFTFVRKREGWSDEAFFQRWAEHTRDFDVVDHPYITKNRLLLIAGDTPYVGKNKDLLTTEDVIMPLSDDGETVDMLFVTVGFI